MSDSLLLDFADDDSQAGFRLHRIEVYNWGTFDQRISTLQLDGLNTLVTGENGSGKSTFVDALTTLLVPANRIAYNRAAGADTRERDLRSYVLGYYRSEYNELTGASKPVALRRTAGTYSVILGVFRNTGFDQVVTMAQAFWPAEQGQPNRFFVLAERELSIAGDFRGFTAGVRQLKSQLRGRGAEVFDAYTQYGPRLRRLVGIHNEQALDLFHQTVSMKAVGNLTEFVRAHMLDTAPIKPRLDHLIAHFDDLTRAHEAVVRAKRQVELLAPIAADGDRHREETVRRDVLEECRRALRPHFGARRVGFLAAELDRLAADWDKAEQQLGRARDDADATRRRVEAINADIAGSGGDELRGMDDRLAELGHERDRRRTAADELAGFAATAGLAVPSDESGFVDLQRAAAGRRADLDAERAATRSRRTDLEISFRDHRRRHADLVAEIDNLRAQRGNIPAAQMQLRQQLAGELSIDVASLPFAGELVRVRDDEQRWEGAAERLLRGFALSMLVPDEHYRAIQRWVDTHHLGQRLVYFRIGGRQRRRDEEIHRFALCDKLELRDDLRPELAAWLDAELVARANLACCDTEEQFVRESRAITVAGQIKGANQRHEKDDRFRIGDRSRYVLGWSNESKIAALSVSVADTERLIGDAGAALAAAAQVDVSTGAVVHALTRLEGFAEFRQIDWRSVAGEITELERSRAALLATSDRLAELEAQLADAKDRHHGAAQAVEAALQRRASITTRIDDTRRDHDELADELRADAPGDVSNAVAERIASLESEVLPATPRRLKELVDAEAKARETLQNEIDATAKRIERLGQGLVGRMKDFAGEFPTESQELDASLDALVGFVEILERLRADDLPRFETEFRELLNENTLREIAGFQQALYQERTDIEERIDKINTSLATIEYNRNRYIALVMEPTRDTDVREFQADLRACTEGTVNMADDAALVEQKFHQVRLIIERLRGRSEHADADRRWAAKVTDVRNWFTYAASERWRTDHSEYEHYSDSSGKSGGQKEKLAYTVLAASLAYQFGLELGETVSRSFRFVAIDEAFGRADTEATRFGLKLFGELHLQLLVVTPLQRISIIEPYVQRVGFVSVTDDRSQITNLTIEEYRKRRGSTGGDAER
ncbi:MAG: ATP-binding protein [Ilumatobacteraceae bacterium]